MNPNKPSKEVLENDLKSGLSIATIAKKYDGSIQSIHDWIRNYGLKGKCADGRKRGSKSTQEEPTPLSGRSRAPMTSGVAVADQVEHPVIHHAPPAEEMVQESPTLAEIEQFHTDNEVQALPGVEFDKTFNIITDDPKDSFTDLVSDCAEDGKTKDFAAAADKPEISPAPLETIDEIWLNVHDDLATLERLYVAQAKKSFRERLADLVIVVAGHRDGKSQEVQT